MVVGSLGFLGVSGGLLGSFRGVYWGVMLCDNLDHFETNVAHSMVYQYCILARKPTAALEYVKNTHTKSDLHFGFPR